MEANRTGNRAFVVTIVSAFLFKLWLTSETRIIGVFAPHDHTNFIEHAKSISMGLWFGHYDQYTLIKVPFFPLYMAGIQEFGIPLPIAHVIFYGLACFVACFAVKPLIRSSFMLNAMFLVLYFNPVESDSISWFTTRSQVNPSVALLTISCAIGLFIRRRDPIGTRIRWATALGASFSAFWLTREESIWMLPALALLLCSYYYGPVRRRDASELRTRSATAGIPVAIWALVTGSIMLLNGIYYGWYTAGENLSPEFVSAYASLARIDTQTPRDLRFPVPRAARLIAYGVSPAARELEPTLEGPLGISWGRYGCQTVQPCDIGPGFFIWALRDSVAIAGHYSSGANAREFYLRMGSEIDAACEARRVLCLPKEHSLAPPIEPADVPQIAANAGNGIQRAARFADVAIPPYHIDGYAPVRQDYDFIVRSVDDGFPYEPAAKDDDLKRWLLVEISQAYQFALPILLVVAFLAAVARCVSFLRKGPTVASPDYLIAVSSIATAFLSLTAILAVVTTLSFPAFNADYMSPLYAIMIAAVMLVAAVEGPIYLRLIETRLPPPKV